ncbi:MAG: hypothetical protein OEU93_02385 [Rubrivivax sp.]|nr:hypothetical protein [Rubrivivax sp.]
MTTTAGPARTPWHLWVVGIVTLLWNAVGAMDYLMTETRNASYLSEFTPAQIEYFDSFPAWAVATWALAVWGGVLGSLLLLFRTRHAVAVLSVSFVAMVLTTVYNYVLSDGLQVMGASVFSIVFSAVIFGVALLLVVYARAMRDRGVLA